MQQYLLSFNKKGILIKDDNIQSTLRIHNIIAATVSYYLFQTFF